MAGPIRVGIVGANPDRGWALQSHLPGIVALPEFKLTAVATTRAESAFATAKRFDVPLAFGDANELIANDEVDLVSICVKVPHHYGYLKSAIAAGKHVYCEWPLGANLEQAVELADLANAAGLSHVVGLQGRKGPLVNFVRDLVADGYVGEVLSVSLNVASAGLGGPQVAQERIWAADKINGANTLSIMAGHNIDVLRYCVGDPKELKSIVAVRNPNTTVIETGAPITVTSPDVILLQGLLESGGYVAINVQTGIPRGSGALFEIQGTTGVLTIRGQGSLHLGDDSLTLTGGSGDSAVAALEVPARYNTVPDAVPVGTARNIAALYMTLGDSILDGSPADPSFDTAVELHRLLAIIDSAASNDSGLVTTT